MMTFLTAIHIATVVLLVITVLLQSGKGAEISASFGGSSQTVFGSSGGANFFQKLTYSLAAVFMITSVTLTVFPSKAKKSVFEGYTPPASSAPVNPAAPVGGDAPAAQNTDAAKAKTETAPATGTNTAAADTKATAPKAEAPKAADQKK